MSKKTEVQTAEPSRFNKEPDDLYFSQTAGMEVSRYGRDRGSIVQDLKCETTIDARGDRAWANRIVDNLDLMLDRGVISDDMYQAGREFQNSFNRAGYTGMKTTNLTGAGGGGASTEERAIGDISARNRVHECMKMVGGDESPMWVALFWIVGQQHSIREASAAHQDRAAVWTGFVKAALYLLGQDYTRRRKIAANKGKKRHR